MRNAEYSSTPLWLTISQAPNPLQLAEFCPSSEERDVVASYQRQVMKAVDGAQPQEGKLPAVLAVEAGLDAMEEYWEQARENKLGTFR